ncbi:MAG: thiosulfate oxidation carrier protein SoxY [Rhodocyclaceae bacterium]
MDQQRRHTLKAGMGLGMFGVLVSTGMLRPGVALAATDRAIFSATTLAEAFAAIGAGKPDQSAEILISAPDIAENGAVVPIGVTTSLPGTEQIAIMVEKNPNMVAATFSIPDGTLPDIQTRVKMAQTSDVWVLVKANGKFHVARKEVRVTLGGCG